MKILKWFKKIFGKKKIEVPIVAETVKVKKLKPTAIKIVLNDRKDLLHWLTNYHDDVKNVTCDKNSFTFYVYETECKHSFREQDEKYPIEFYYLATRKMSARYAIIPSTVTNNNDWFVRGILNSMIGMLRTK